VEDTPHFLRDLSQFSSTKLPENTTPISIDVVGLYSNIPLDEGIAAFEEALNRRIQQEVSTKLLISLLTIVLFCNVFEFNGRMYQQMFGTAMGTRVAPTFANLFMGMLECFILENTNPKLIACIFKKFWRRFIDDIFLLWTGSESEFEEFMTALNSIHPHIKFTATYNFTTKTVPYLDVLVTVQAGKIVTDLYRKPSAAVQYLLPTSCHPGHVARNIPFSLGYRILRICSDGDTMIQRLRD